MTWQVCYRRSGPDPFHHTPGDVTPAELADAVATLRAEPHVYEGVLHCVGDDSREVWLAPGTWTAVFRV